MPKRSCRTRRHWQRWRHRPCWCNGVDAMEKIEGELRVQDGMDDITERISQSSCTGNTRWSRLAAWSGTHGGGRWCARFLVGTEEAFNRHLKLPVTLFITVHGEIKDSHRQSQISSCGCCSWLHPTAARSDQWAVVAQRSC